MTFYKIYNSLLIIFFPFILITFFFRVLQGKEENKRLLERLGINLKHRSLHDKVVWFHTCSVGEAKSVIGLAKLYEKKNFTVLITSNTILSGLYIKKNFPNTIIHQFVPFDFRYSVNNFLNYWKPTIGIFVESELWPNLIYMAKKKNIPLFLIQARFSEKTLKKWKYFLNWFKSLLNSFDLIIPISKSEKNKIEKHTKIDVCNAVNLKLSSPKLLTCSKEILRIRNKISKYKVISALSTHRGEEKLLIAGFKSLKKKYKNIILIIQPRHPKRIKEIKEIIIKKNLLLRIKSSREYPEENTDVYLYDTFGESGNLISLSNIIILGGTISPIGGHNIIEPAQFGKCIISSEHHFKIKDNICLFKKNNAVFTTKNNKLAKAIEIVLNNKCLSNTLGKNAYKLTKTFQNNDKIIYKKLKDFMKK